MALEPQRPQSILVVDDNPANRQVAEGHLVAAGYRVTLAESGEAGLAAFRTQAPDLVLLDILMPGLDGFDTCARIKELPGSRDVPVVFLTALADFTSHQRALEAGADDFLTKPINRTELLIRVRSLLWVKRLKDELTQGYDLIRSQRDALLQAQRQKEELSALVVHDLKNPLTGILVNARYLQADPAFTGDTHEALRDIVTSAEVMHRMVMNLLDISRSEDGTLVPRLDALELDELVEVTCATVRRRLEERRLELQLALEVRTIRADRDLLQRLLENLLDNAIKYTPPGGAVRIETGLRDDGLVSIRVIDTGTGIPPESREQIFQKYARLEGSAEVARTSRGLGLAFCRLAAEAHGGRIWVEDQPPVGTAFCVLLPLAPPAVA
jgi:signal transduction histidine kinase